MGVLKYLCYQEKIVFKETNDSEMATIPPHKFFLTDNDYYGGDDIQETNGFEPATLPAEGNQYFLTQNDYYAENRDS